MESVGNTFLAIASKSKNYEDYEKEENPDFLSFKKAFESNLSSLISFSLQGNSYSKVFCEQISHHLKKAIKLEVFYSLKFQKLIILF